MKKVLVLMGGMSSEREISILSGTSVANALKKAGYEVKTFDLTTDLMPLLITLKTERPEVVFNALHGKYGEDGCIQGLLNILDIPYTHSGVLASSIGMDKEMALKIVSANGVSIPKGRLMSRDELMQNEPERPYVIKPNAEGSSVGVFIVDSDEEKEKALTAWTMGQKLLVEEYIAGLELSAAVLDGKGVGIVEIKPKTGYYDFKNKYTEGAAVHIIPASIPPTVYQEILRQAEIAHQVLGCRGVSRSDFRFDPKTGRICFLEINTNPGMTGLSLVPEIAQKCQGLSYEELVSHLVEEAQCDA